MLETAWHDLRHGARMLAKNPGFASIAVLSIAIGVGANAAMFSIADGLIFRPLAVPDPATLVTVSATTPTGEVRTSGISYPDYVDLRDRARSFEGLTASRGVAATMSRERGEPAQGSFGLAVSGNFFDVLHVQATIGRTFVPDEDRVPGRDGVIVLSHETWTRLFGAEPGIVGRQVRLSGEPFTVIGVMPEAFTGTNLYLPPAFYVPLAMLPRLVPAERPGALERRDLRTLRVVGRLAPGVAFDQAREEVRLTGIALERAYPDTARGYGLLLRTETEDRFAEYAPMLALGVMLVGLALAVLLVACANVAGLLTSRAPVRAREMALRLAIGGSRARLIRQLITESFLIAAAGGAVGFALGYAGIRSFQQFQVSTDAGVRLTYALDRRALVVGFAAAAVSALLSSLVPAWQSTRTRDLSGTMRHAPVGSRTPRLWGRHGLVAAQIALTLVVLTVAVSFYRAFEAEYGRGPGFRTDGLVLASLDPGIAQYDERRADEFYRGLEERVSAIPGVNAVAMTSFVPLSMDGGGLSTIIPEGYELPPGVQGLDVSAARVDDDYLETIGIPIVSGRGFSRSDTSTSPLVAIVSRGMAERYWPGETPLGKRIRVMNTSEWVQVIGVAEDAKFRLFTPSSTPFLYLPRLQHPVARSTLVVGTAGDSASLAGAIRTAIIEVDPEVPVLSLRTMEDFYYANARNLNTVVVRTIAGMGAMGLALASIGLYGLMAYAVSRRTREIGIRMAIGAMPGSVLRMFWREGTLPSAVGIAAGVMASIAVGGVVRSAFAGAGDNGVTYLLVVPFIVIVVMLAAYVPARRAARIDPLAALRHD